VGLEGGTIVTAAVTVALASIKSLDTPAPIVIVLGEEEAGICMYWYVLSTSTPFLATATVGEPSTRGSPVIVVRRE